jgi:HNH endonuclease
MRCIFCKNDSSNSRSIEHVIPESLGSKRRILKAGIVCDKCNNYFARKVESPVINHPSMKNFRAWYQVPNKRGRYPALHGYVGGTDINIGLKVNKEGDLQLEPECSSNEMYVDNVINNGFIEPVIFIKDLNPPKREMSRFLCKMALEHIAETITNEPSVNDLIVDTDFYDNIRTYARYGNNFEDWPFSQRKIFPEETLMRHPETNEWVQIGFGCCWFFGKYRETLFAFLFYGTEFVVNVGGPSIKGYKEWLIDHGNISPLIERIGCRIVTKTEEQSKKYYLYGTQDIKKGFEFDKKHGYAP